jgi:hypothetical protein
MRTLPIVVLYQKFIFNGHLTKVVNSLTCLLMAVSQKNTPRGILPLRQRFLCLSAAASLCAGLSTSAYAQTALRGEANTEGGSAEALFVRTPVAPLYIRDLLSRRDLTDDRGYERAGPYSKTDTQSGVRNRTRPDFDPTGRRFGSFEILPSFTNALVYDTNVYATRQDKKRDGLLLSSPRLNIQSDWSRHALAFDFGADMVRYKEFSSEDRNDYGGRMRHRFDFSHEYSLSTTLRAAKLHETRGSTTDPLTTRAPIGYESYLAEMEFKRSQQRLTYTLGTRVRRNVFGFEPQIGGGVSDLRFRTGNVYSTYFRPSYSLTPLTRIFALTDITRRDYREVMARTNDPDSWSYSGQVGIALDPSKLWNVQMSVGHVRQLFDSAFGRDISAPAFGLTLDWNPTEQVSVRLGVTRDIAEVTDPSQLSRINTTIAGTLDYEVWRNLIASVSGKVTYQDYIGIDRHDTVYVADAHLDYFINQRLAMGLFYAFEGRRSPVFAQSYTRSLIGLSLKAQF